MKTRITLFLLVLLTPLVGVRPAAAVVEGGLDCGLIASSDPTQQISSPDWRLGVLWGGPYVTPGTNPTMVCRVFINNNPQARTTLVLGTVTGREIFPGARDVDFGPLSDADYITVCTTVSWDTPLGRTVRSHCDGVDSRTDPVTGVHTLVKLQDTGL